MAFYMRYISIDDEDITLDIIDEALQGISKHYSLKDQSPTPPGSALIGYGKSIYGQMVIKKAGDDDFDEKVKELKELAGDMEGVGKENVLEVLDMAEAVVSVEVIFEGREIERTLMGLDPLWEWLFDHREGLLQVDDEGWYEKDELLLEV